jgi:hypothetical protein
VIRVVQTTLTLFLRCNRLFDFTDRASAAQITRGAKVGWDILISGTRRAHGALRQASSDPERPPLGGLFLSGKLPCAAASALRRGLNPKIVERFPGSKLRSQPARLFSAASPSL